VTNPVATPRHTYSRLSDLARLLGVPVMCLYPYLTRRGRGYALRPLDERRYAGWHAHHGYARQEAPDAP
jgi:hypothetical protein